jgi:hypothetical protein
MKYFTILLIPVLLVSGLFFMTSCEEDANAPSETTTFSGKIVDNQQLGVINATVEALNSSNRVLINKTITDENGNFTLDKLPANFQSVIIKISHPDFIIYEQNLNSFKEKTANGSTPFVLTNQDSCCGRFSAVVTDSATGEAINEAQIKITKNNDLVKKSYTNDNGELVFQPLCPGEYVARIYKEGYSVIEQVFNIEDCDTVNFEFLMRSTQSDNDSCCNGVLYVALKYKSSGERMNGKVKIGKSGTVTAWKETTEGVAKFEDLCPGTYMVWAASEGYQTQEFEVTFDCNDTVEVSRQLERTATNDSCCNGKIIIVVKDQSGNALNGASVKLTKDGQVIGTKNLDLNVARFENLCEGTYWVRVAKEGYQTQEFEVQLDCNEVEELVRNLASNNTQDSCCDGILYVIPKDKTTGSALNGATVKIYKNGQQIAYKTVEGGYAKFTDLCKGVYLIKIIAEGYTAISFEYEMGCNTEQEVSKSMEKTNTGDSCCDGRIKLVVKDKNTGSIITGATVKLWKSGTLVATKTVSGDYLVFERVCKGIYGMDIIAEGYQGIEFQVEIGCNETIYLTKELQSNNASDTCYTAILKLAVKDSTNSSAISGATIRIYHGDELVAEGETSAEGYYMKENLMAPAEYRVVVSKDGYVSKAFEFYFNECKKIAETVRLTPQ